MERTYLVQRLEKPWCSNDGSIKVSPFSFGGGRRNGGLSDDAMSLIKEIWGFDYMGAAEFEFGAVPEALSKMAKAKLIAFSFAIPLKEVAPNWGDQTKQEPEGEATIYVVCPEELKQDVEQRILELAALSGRGSREQGLWLKESTQFNSALRPVNDYDREKCGWLELENGFAFFIDKEMWEKTAHLFGVKITEVAT